MVPLPLKVPHFQEVRPSGQNGWIRVGQDISDGEAGECGIF